MTQRQRQLLMAIIEDLEDEGRSRAISYRAEKIEVLQALVEQAQPSRKPLTDDEIVDAYCKIADGKEWAIGGLKDGKIENMNVTSKAFEDWWDSNKPELGDNPFRPDSAAYWAWAGWRAATLAERERCAKVCEAQCDVWVDGSDQWGNPCPVKVRATVYDCAAAIRKGEREKAPTPCIGNDQTCPCNDGDVCNYRDSGKTKAWPVPKAATDLKPPSKQTE